MYSTYANNVNASADDKALFRGSVNLPVFLLTHGWGVEI